uniref:restriction endonuclease subunit S n=1 Tax=Bifidobacterium longum TaxID=216816 RepID=UPI00359C210F
MTEQAKVPAIRFAGFTDPWEQRKLENLASFGGGHTPPMADAGNYVDGKILWITSQDVKQHYIENTTTMISEKGAATLTLYPSDSIVIVARSGILRHTIPVAKLRKPATVNQDIKVIQTVDSCDSSWLLQYFIASNKTLLREYGKTGTTVESIDFAKMKSTALMVPYIEEQQAIGSFFSRLDDLITLHQRKYDKLVIFKKSMLEKMFPKDGESVPEIRFAGFTDPWEQRKLGELSSEFQSGDFISAEEILGSGPYPVYGGNGLRGYAKQYNHDGFYALIGRQGALCGNVNTAVGKAYFTEHAVAVKANFLHDTRFLAHLLGCMDLGRYSGQSAQPGLAVGVLKEVETTVPSKAEQQAIGSFFSRLDSLITLHQRKLELLQDIKKSLLDKMFV